MFFVREIKYLNYYHYDKKVCSAGTVKCHVRGKMVTFEFYLKKLPIMYPVRAKLQFCTGRWEKSVESSLEMNEKEAVYKTIFEMDSEFEPGVSFYICISFGDHQLICDENTQAAYVKQLQNEKREDVTDKLQKEEAAHEEEKDRIKEEAVPEGNDRIKEEAVPEETNRIERKEVAEPDDDTDPVAQQKKIVHLPARNGQIQQFYVLKPEELRYFGSAFAEFADNSFLLHGYYNYRHVLVGPIQSEDLFGMQIGVPGNYYEREEVVAAMFGFRDFVPVKGQKETGAFGYYFAG